MTLAETRRKLRHFFHSHKFHWILGTLIAVDLTAVLTDIALLIIWPQGSYRPPTVAWLETYLPYFSIGILSLFFIELLIQVFAFGVVKWFRNGFHIFDFVVVLATLIIEIVAHVLFHHEVTTVFGLAIIVRLWRVIRVIHVTTEALDLPHEEEVHELKKKIKMLERELSKYQAFNGLGDGKHVINVAGKDASQRYSDISDV